MLSFHDLKGTIMYGNEQIAYFELDGGEVVKCKRLGNVRHVWEFTHGVSDEEAVLEFLEDRVTPDTRIGIHDDIKRAGIPYYDGKLMIEYNNGNSAMDTFWIKLETGPQTYEDMIEIRKKHNKEIFKL